MNWYLVSCNAQQAEGGEVSVKSTRGVPITVLTPPQYKTQAKITAETVAHAVDFFEVYLDSPYPFEKLDVMGIYDFNAGGMENIGMIHTLYDCAYADLNSITAGVFLYCMEVLVHEVSHMWFGNLVSLKWWDDLWLKEGFARYITLYAVDKMRNQLKVPVDVNLMRLAKRGYIGAFGEDKEKFTKPVRRKLENSFDAAAMFNSLSYSKGGWILRAAMKLMGENAFQKGLQTYFKRFAWKSANFNDFTACFNNVNGDVSMRQFMENWLNEPGLPQVTTKLPDTLQHRSPQLWKSKKGVHTFAKTPSWFHLDPEYAGFVLHNYPEETMMAIAKQFREDHTKWETSQRYLYFENLIERMNTNDVSSTVFLETSRYLSSETNSQVVLAWARQLLGFKNSLFMAENMYLFDKYMHKLLKPHIENTMKREIEETKDWNLALFYQTMFYFGVKWRHEAALVRGRENVKRFLRGKHVNVIYLSFGLRHHKALVKNSWMKLLKILNSYPRSHIEFALIIGHLCKTRNVKQQRYILNYSLKCNKMPRSHKKKVLCRVSARNPQLGWSFFKKHYPTYFALFGEAQFTFDDLVECVTGNLSTQSEYNDVRDFFKKHPVGSGAAGLKRGLHSISLNVSNRSGNGSTHRAVDYDEVFTQFLDTLGDKELAR
eukprot:sb/3462817/